MNTASLRKFATWARTELITQVHARIDQVLAPGSLERVEHASTVSALEKALNAHGDDHIADTVAYIWFNRIIALRFMDANNYTATGVVSPADPTTYGQPEILTLAKRGEFTPYTPKATQQTILSLLNGTKPSTNPQAEAYNLLLKAECDHRRTVMPFLFGDAKATYIDILAPADMLSTDSVLMHAQNTLTAQACADVEVIGWLYQFYISERKDEVFAGFNNNKKAGVDEIPAATQLFTPHWIVRYLAENSIGRLWMQNHPDSHLIDHMDYYIPPVDDADTDFLKITSPEQLTVIDPACGSGHMLTYSFDLLYAIYEEEGYAPSAIPGLILTHNLYGTEIDPRAGALASFALMMKARGKQRTFLKQGNRVEPHIQVIEPIEFTDQQIAFLSQGIRNDHGAHEFWNAYVNADIFGSLINPNPDAYQQAIHHITTLDDTTDLLLSGTLAKAQQHLNQTKYLTNHYAVTIANPPYMANKRMPEVLKAFLKEHFSTGSQDLYGAYILRGLELTTSHGFLAEIVGDTWMSIVSFKELREFLINRHHFDSFLHLTDISNHPDIFGANAAFILANNASPRQAAPFIRLTPSNSAGKQEALLKAIEQPDINWRYSSSPEDLNQVPGTPLAYWLPDEVRKMFLLNDNLGNRAHPRVGMQTANNQKYLRRWWEISAGEIQPFDLDSPPKWIFYLKGGNFRRWWGNIEYVLHYNFDASYIRQQRNASVMDLPRAFATKVTWTDFTSGFYSARLSPVNTFHDISGHCFYPVESDTYWVLGYANSKLFQEFLWTLNSTTHAQVGDISRIPLPEMNKDNVSRLSKKAVEISRRDFNRSETSPDFQGNELIQAAEGNSVRLDDIYAQLSASWKTECTRLAEIEEEINHEIDPENYSGRSIHRFSSPVSLSVNPDYVFANRSMPERTELLRGETARSLISYAIGCMFGRYSLDKPGLILANEGSTLEDYLRLVPKPTFQPDPDNVLPVVDGDWFEDDIVTKLRQFLRTTLGETHLTTNIQFLTNALGVKNLRDYFIAPKGKRRKSPFYDDHLQRYKKRPIYWMFSTPSGSFNALIYLHRYTPDTVSTVLNEYLREYQVKLEATVKNLETQSLNATTAKDKAQADKQAKQLRETLLELRDYEHDTLYPLATANTPLNLDDGVENNYAQLQPALRKIK
ncbi:BREX-1 system adenine-specific DNA-methyltransferase PglX [Corynebacterium phoceense]|uniref:BREX-1 system adenine-specific DNA-methyltransferase PglX n=1 Tax=Corynebacterium phoceense TaxID=1686286 RepID=UPI001D3978A9|nr:BREX-1 system adenine-specific DNA-methyltransferase PglX [Corynebacterium phoceense]HJG42480.1 BREX-1 system adenine-specific DNA-methyltransferase PglX [Corynebacterium phoceense]